MIASIDSTSLVIASLFTSKTRELKRACHIFRHLAGDAMVSEEAAWLLGENRIEPIKHLLKYSHGVVAPCTHMPRPKTNRWVAFSCSLLKNGSSTATLLFAKALTISGGNILLL